MISISSTIKISVGSLRVEISFSENYGDTKIHIFDYFELLPFLLFTCAKKIFV